MHETSEAVNYYLRKLHAGEKEEPFFGLLDLGSSALPLLMAEALKIENKSIKADLIEIIWQYRQPDVISFLGERLHDSDPEVWQQSFDGLIAIGGLEAKHEIQKALEDVKLGTFDNGLSKEWLEEALDFFRKSEKKE